MKEAEKKRKLTAIAAAAAVILAIAGAMAYFSYAAGGDNSAGHVEAEIIESGISPAGGVDNGTVKSDVLPGISVERDLTIKLDADTDAFVYAVVKDTINSHGIDLVSYDIAGGWTELDKAGLEPMQIEKAFNIFSEKAPGTLEFDPQDTRTKIYYRVEHGTALSHSFEYPVLKDNRVFYSGVLTNNDVGVLKNLSDDEKALIFQTYAIQMQPFCNPDATGAELIQGAKDAWNQQVRVTGISLNKDTLTLNVEDEETLIATITPDSATNKDVKWTSSNPDVATVDEVGKVTAVAPGTATITATSAADNTKTATCVVTVGNVASVKYAVQIYNTFDFDEDGTIDTLDFGPAIGVNVTQTYVSACDSEHCIHNDSWTRIKEHPEDYTACKAAGCTKAVVLSIPSDTTGTIWASDAAEKTTTGDGVGVLIDELTTQARVWHASENIKIDDFSGKYEEATICGTLNELYNALPNDLKNAITEKTVSYKVWNKESGTYSLRYSGSVTQKLWLQNEEDIVSAGKGSYDPIDLIGLAKSDGLKSYNINGKVGNRWTSTSNISTNSRPDEDDNWGAATIDDDTYNEHINGTDTKVKAGISPGFRISTSD